MKNDLVFRTPCGLRCPRSRGLRPNRGGRPLGLAALRAVLRDPATQARLLGATLGLAITGTLFAVTEMAAFAVTGCSAWGCR